MAGEARHVGPISAINSSAVRLSTPGIVSSSATLSAKGAITSSTRPDSTSIDSSRKLTWARIWPTISAWWEEKRPTSASLSAGSLAGSRPLASSASSSGSCVPWHQSDRGELDASVLQELVQQLHLARTLLDLGLAVASQVAQLADRARRHETRAHQPVLDRLADPLGVADVALAAWHVARVLRVQEPAIELVLTHVLDRPPVDAGRLHPHQRDPEAAQPVEQDQQPPSRRREAARLLPALAASPDTRTQAVTESVCTSSPAQRSISRSISFPLPIAWQSDRPGEPPRVRV
jgi:hypothetical protein